MQQMLSLNEVREPPVSATTEALILHLCATTSLTSVAKQVAEWWTELLEQVHVDGP
jgi:hypothetical protein